MSTPALPLSLYIHIPWCLAKCPYCDFNSHALVAELDEAAYVDALLADLELDLPRVAGRSLSSVFIGGGTPSRFSAANIERLLQGAASRIPAAPDVEITLEANPGTLEAGRFGDYRGAGINRLSIGVQSFNDDHLKALGRVHDRQQALEAVTAARAAGFDNLNLDLMFALPGQSVAQALEDVATAVALGPAHISYYQLTMEPNTHFHASPPELPAEAEQWEIERQGQGALEQAGYERYEISAFARPGQQCRHNLNYWRFGDYIGIGAGAHGKLTDGATGAVLRNWRVRSPDAYLAPAGRDGAIAGCRILQKEDRIMEFMMNALRLREGFRVELFAQRTGCDLDEVEAQIAEAAGKGLIERDCGVIRPTPRGHRYLNELLSLFVPEVVNE
jgi:oxygen-independent coproporphyrinogen-3 oxidase